MIAVGSVGLIYIVLTNCERDIIIAGSIVLVNFGISGILGLKGGDK